VCNAGQSRLSSLFGFVENKITCQRQQMDIKQAEKELYDAADNYLRIKMESLGLKIGVDMPPRKDKFDKALLMVMSRTEQFLPGEE
jgi:hypothetical protein